jgi:hypothetical protein
LLIDIVEIFDEPDEEVDDGPHEGRTGYDLGQAYQGDYVVNAACYNLYRDAITF